MMKSCASVMGKQKLTVLSEGFFRRFSEVFSPYLKSGGIDPQVLNSADIEIPEDRYIALWEAVGRQHHSVGIEIGSQSLPDDIGVLGHALNCAPNIGKALETLHQFIVVFAQKSRIDFEVGTKQVTVDYQINDPTIVYRRQDAEFAIATILRQFQLITDEKLRPVRVDFEHLKPDDTSEHKRFFRCPVYFGQSINRLYFSSEILNLELTKGNERLYQALQPYLERQRELRTDTDELLSQITHIIAKDLSSNIPSIGVVSEQLGMSTRTLQRSLKKHEIEFSVLLDDVRRELAIAYVTDSDYSITEIAMLVGYSESASFSRAFRRWTGKTPRQYRSSQSA